MTPTSVMPAAFRRPGPLPTIPADKWCRLRETGDRELRSEIITAYAPLVRRVALQMAGALPPHISADDLTGWGCVGLMAAVDAYDPDRGVKFATYAVPRIRGSMIDEMRGMDWVPRSVRSAVGELHRTTDALAHQLGRHPVTAEVAAEMGATEARVRALTDHARSARQPTPISDLMYGDRDGDDATIELPDPVSIDDVIDGWADAEVVREAVHALSPVHRRVLVAYYWGGQTVRHIGEAIGVSESRVSQLHHQALARLRAILAQQGIGPDGVVRGLRGHVNRSSLAQSA